MQKNSFIVLLLVLLFSQEKIAAQNNLSLKEAVTIAIQNSYDIKLVENNLSIAQNNNNYGVAGGLPTVTANGTNNNTLTTINQTFPDASRNTTRSGVDGSTLNGGLTATMILFNGYRIAATKDRLESIQKQTEAALQVQMLNTSSTVMQQYYNVIRQVAFLKTIEKSIEVERIIKCRLQEAIIGIIETIGITATDSQMIFTLINKEGTKLSAVEILSAKPSWNITVKSPSNDVEKERT
jgi:hypothetical protein